MRMKVGLGVNEYFCVKVSFSCWQNNHFPEIIFGEIKCENVICSIFIMDFLYKNLYMKIACQEKYKLKIKNV